jgi:HSP20 family protein
MRQSNFDTNQNMFHAFKPVIDELINEIDSSVKAKQTNVKANILETEDSFVIQLGALGHSKETVKIQIFDNLLKVEGQSVQTEGNYKLKEFTPQAFSRNFNLPKNTDRDQIKAKFENGILYITLIKSTPSSLKVDIL